MAVLGVAAAVHPVNVQVQPRPDVAAVDGVAAIDLVAACTGAFQAAAFTRHGMDKDEEEWSRRGASWLGRGGGGGTAPPLSVRCLQLPHRGVEVGKK